MITNWAGILPFLIIHKQSNFLLVPKSEHRFHSNQFIMSVEQQSGSTYLQKSQPYENAT